MFTHIYLMNLLVHRMKEHESEFEYHQQLLEYLSGRVPVADVQDRFYLPLSANEVYETLKGTFGMGQVEVLCVSAMNSNSLFVVRSTLRGKTIWGIPLRGVEEKYTEITHLLVMGDNGTFYVTLDELDNSDLSETNTDNIIVGKYEIHLEKITNTFDVLSKLGDTPFTIIPNERYRLAFQKLTNQTITIDNEPTYISFILEGDKLKTLMVSTEEGEDQIVLACPMDIERILDDIIITVSPDFIMFTIFKSKGLCEHLEGMGYFYSNIGKNIMFRECAQLMIEESARRAVNDATRSSLATTATGLPAEAGRKILDMDKKFRALVSRLRKMKDERLRDKLMNDEFIPLIDDFWSWIISATVTYGGVFWLAVNPLVALVAGATVKLLFTMNHESNKKKVMRMLDERIVRIDEEIEDARSNNNLKLKNQLIQVKQKLERQRDKIKGGKSISAI